MPGTTNSKGDEAIEEEIPNQDRAVHPMALDRQGDLEDQGAGTDRANGDGDPGDPADQVQAVVAGDAGDDADAMIANRTVQTTTIGVLK